MVSRSIEPGHSTPDSTGPDPHIDLELACQCLGRCSGQPPASLFTAHILTCGCIAPCNCLGSHQATPLRQRRETLAV